MRDKYQSLEAFYYYFLVGNCTGIVPKAQFRQLFWIPDLYFYHVHSMTKTGLFEVEEHVQLHEGREVRTLVTLLIGQNCKFGFAWFPFDFQTCSVAVGSNWMQSDVLNFTGTFHRPQARSTSDKSNRWKQILLSMV